MPKVKNSRKESRIISTGNPLHYISKPDQCYNFEGPETPPKNFTASAISSRSAHLSWLPPPREHHNGLIRHFWINITEINTGRRFKRTLFSTATVLSSLHPYYTYQFSVAAYRN